MTRKTTVQHAARQKNGRKTNLAEIGLVLFVFFTLLLVIVALSQALSAYHTAHHAARENSRSTITRIARRSLPRVAPRSVVSFGTESNAS